MSKYISFLNEFNLGDTKLNTAIGTIGIIISIVISIVNVVKSLNLYHSNHQIFKQTIQSSWILVWILSSPILITISSFYISMYPIAFVVENYQIPIGIQQLYIIISAISLIIVVIIIYLSIKSSTLNKMLNESTPVSKFCKYLCIFIPPLSFSTMLFLRINGIDIDFINNFLSAIFIILYAMSAVTFRSKVITYKYRHMNIFLSSGEPLYELNTDHVSFKWDKCIIYFYAQDNISQKIIIPTSYIIKSDYYDINKISDDSFDSINKLTSSIVSIFNEIFSHS